MIGLPISNTPIFLSHVQCLGSEGSLLNCSSEKAGSHQCGINNGAGVRCGGNN